MSIAIELIGWLGAALILLACILLSLGRIDGRSRNYQLIALPSSALNLIWLAMGAYVLLLQRSAK